jgi:hypothetical protein
MGQPTVTSVIWPDRSRPICGGLPESLWDSQRTLRKNQICQNVKHSKTPNVLFPISLQFLRELREFISHLTHHGMRVNNCNYSQGIGFVYLQK